MTVLVDGRTIQDHFPGVARYTFHLLKALAESPAGGDLAVLYHRGAANRRYDLSILERRPGVRLIPSDAGPFSWAEQVRLPWQVRRLRPRLSHLPYTIRPFAWPRPVVATVHDVIPVVFPQGFSARQRLFFRLTMRLHTARADRVIAVSQATATDLMRHFAVPAGRIAVVPEGVDPGFRPRPAGEVAVVRQRYGLPDRYLLYLGINKPHKNLVRLVEAYARLGPDAPSLVLAGREDPRYPQARQQALALGLAERVLFPGDIAEDDLPALYSGAAVFVFPSLYEGFGLPPLEAMASGAPVVCSAASSLPEVVGDAAVLCDPLDVDNLAATLRRLLADPDLRRRLRQAGLDRAAQFTWQRAAAQTQAVYNQLMA